MCCSALTRRSDHHTIVLSGVAGLVGGALSMAVGEGPGREGCCRWRLPTLTEDVNACCWPCIACSDGHVDRATQALLRSTPHLLAALATLFPSATGEYISVSSQRDAEAADIEAERQAQLSPESRAFELEELTQVGVLGWDRWSGQASCPPP